MIDGDYIDILGRYPAGYHGFINVIRPCKRGERVQVGQFRYSVIEVKDGEVRFDHPLEEEIENTVGQLL